MLSRSCGSSCVPTLTLPIVHRKPQRVFDPEYTRVSQNGVGEFLDDLQPSQRISQRDWNSFDT